jgi:hypothetical protein
VRHLLFGRDERLDDLRVEDRAALRYLVQRPDDLVEVADTLLQQVSESGGAVLQQFVGVLLLRVLRQNDDADVRMLLANSFRGVDPLGRVGWGHPDVGENGLRAGLLDLREQLVKRRGRSDQIDGTRVLEERRGPLPHEVVILREDHADHGRMVHAAIWRRGAA